MSDEERKQRIAKENRWMHPFQRTHLMIYQWIEENTKNKRLQGVETPGYLTNNAFERTSVFHRFDCDQLRELRLRSHVQNLIPNDTDTRVELKIPAINDNIRLQKADDYSVVLEIISEPKIKLKIDGNDTYNLPWDKSLDFLRNAVMNMKIGWLPILRIFKKHGVYTHTAEATTDQTHNGFVMVVKSSLAVLKKEVHISSPDVASDIFFVARDCDQRTVETVNMEGLEQYISSYLDLVPSRFKSKLTARYATLDQRVSTLLLSLKTDEHHI
jgi:hypothetical protein